MATFAAGLRTHAGQVRTANQDAGFIGEQVFAVADGMGGHAAGEVASAVAIETIQAMPIRSVDDLVDLVQAANAAIFEQASTESTMRGMGTTFCALALVRDDLYERLVVVNVGDSRVYVLQDDELRQITRDHSFVEDLVAAGEITHEEARHHPNRNILTRALGIEPYVEVDSWEVTPRPGDRFLLCSDGLFNEVDDRHITEAMRTITAPQECADVLVRLANDAGGRDNVTVLVVDVVDAEPLPASTTTWAGTVDEDPATGPPTQPAPAGGWLDDVPELDRSDVLVTPAPIEATSVDEPPPPRQRRKRFTWRVALFWLVLVAIIVAPVFIIRGWVGYGYTVKLDGDEVVLLKGRPDGILWFEPEVIERLDLPVDEISEPAVARLRDGQHYASRSEAENYIDNLREDAKPDVPTVTTRPNTSTTRPTTTTRPRVTTTRSPATTSGSPATTIAP